MDVQSPGGQTPDAPAERGTDGQAAEATAADGPGTPAPGIAADRGTDGRAAEAAAESPGGQPAGAPAASPGGLAAGGSAGQRPEGRPTSRRRAGIRHFRIWRGSADGGDLQDFDVEVNEGEVVLDVIHRLQATQAGDLAVRWNCKAGKCGSCSAEINGMPRLMCMTRMGIFAQDETVVVTPLRTFPVIKDLVTDVSFNYEKAKQIPAFMPRPREADGTYRMAQVDVERSQEFRKCIECFLCQDTCHVIRDHEENKPAFSGPRFLIRLAELDMHPLDTNDRKRLSQDEAGLGLCNITKCCTEVCPEHIKITDNGIIPLKERVVDTRYDPLVWLGNKIRRRSS